MNFVIPVRYLLRHGDPSSFTGKQKRGCYVFPRIEDVSKQILLLFFFLKRTIQNWPGNVFHVVISNYFFYFVTYYYIKTSWQVVKKHNRPLTKEKKNHKPFRDGENLRGRFGV